MPNLTQYHLKSQQNATLEAIRHTRKLKTSPEKNFLMDELSRLLELLNGEQMSLTKIKEEYAQSIIRIDEFFTANLVGIKEKNTHLELIAVLPILAWSIASIMISYEGHKKFKLDINWFGECLSEFTLSFIKILKDRYKTNNTQEYSIIPLIIVHAKHIVYTYQLKTEGTIISHFACFNWISKISKRQENKGLSSNEIEKKAEKEDPDKFQKYSGLNKVYNSMGGFRNRFPTSFEDLTLEGNNQFPIKDLDNDLTVIYILKYQTINNGMLNNIFSDREIDIIQMYLGIRIVNELSLVYIQSLQFKEIRAIIGLTQNEMENKTELIANKLFYIYCMEGYDKEIDVVNFVDKSGSKIFWSRVENRRRKYQKEYPDRIFTLGKGASKRKKTPKDK